MRRALRSLKGRAALAASLAVGVALVLAGALICVVTERADRRALDSDLRAVAARLKDPATQALGLPPATVLQAGGAFTVASARDAVLRRTGVPQLRVVPPAVAVAPGPVPALPAPAPSVAPTTRRATSARRAGRRTPARPTPARAPRVQRLSPAPFLGLRPSGAPPSVLEPGGGRFARALLPDGQAVVAGAAVPAGWPRPRRIGLRTVELPDGTAWRASVTALGGGARLEVAAPLDPLRDDAARTRRIAGGAVVAGLLLTGLLSWLLAGLALRPLAGLRAAAAGVRDTADLGTRVGTAGGPEEVAALAGELDGMLERLQTASGQREAALASARRFAADAGHELRTPLQGLRANLDLAADERSPEAARADALRAAADEAGRLTRLVDGLQALARGEAGLAASGPVDLADVADAAVAGVRVRHPGFAVALDAPQAGPVVRGDADGLRRALDNLLENAARHGAATARVRLTSAGGTATAAIEDDGPGIPAEERARVTERFARGAAAAGTEGTGLGLAIVAAEAARHGGRLLLGDAPAGGLLAALELPLA